MDEFDERDIWQEKDDIFSLFRFTPTSLIAFGACLGGVFLWILFTIMHWGGK